MTNETQQQKTIIYLPNLTQPSRMKIDEIYRRSINLSLAHANKLTLPVNHICLKLNLNETDLWVENVEALSNYEGYIVLELTEDSVNSWDYTTSPKDRMIAVTKIHNLLLEMNTLLHSGWFKPKHIVLAGDWISNSASFICNMMFVENIPAVRDLRIQHMGSNGDVKAV